MLAEHEPRRYLAVRQALRDQAQDLELARGEELVPVRSSASASARPRAAAAAREPAPPRPSPDFVETPQRHRRLARGRVLTIQRGQHRREFEPRARKLEGSAARREELDRVLEPLARSLLVAGSRRDEPLREARRGEQRTRPQLVRDRT